MAVSINKPSHSAMLLSFGAYNFHCEAICSVMNVSTADIHKSNACLAWLKEHNARGLDQIVFQYSAEAGGSLGCYAKQNFAKGDVMFAIPQKCLFGIENTRNTELSEVLRKTAVELGDSQLLTSELLIWLHMCAQRADPTSMFYPFFHSLDVHPPNLDNWPEELKTAFSGTSLATSIAPNAPQNSLLTHAKLITQALSDSTQFNPDHFNTTSLHWARGHYLSRRYPGKYAMNHSVLTETEVATEGREYGMQNLGVMVSLLDILNHDASREWLRFEVKDEMLQVICNYPRKKGQELFSNYGALSNEVLLYAYGFAVPNNPFDSVSFKLVNRSSSGGSGCSESQSFSIAGGGMSGVPEELWQALSEVLGTQLPEDQIDNNNEENDGPHIGMDECDALLQYLERKLQSLDESEGIVDELKQKYRTANATNAKRRKLTTPSSTVDTSSTETTSTTDSTGVLIEYIQRYRQGQRSILEELAQELQEILESAEGGGSGGEAGEEGGDE